MTAEPLRILILGAHPDDADIKAGGTAAKWSAMGHVVRLVSLTDGGAGHQSERGPELARRRRAEAEAAAAIIGASSEVGGVPDGTLDDGIESRHRVIRLIRSFRPDLILTHRPTDDHPDHRFAGLLVQDAAYLLTVPAICPDSPHLAASPVVLDFSDAFRKPCRFEPHVTVDIGREFDEATIVGDVADHGGPTGRLSNHPINAATSFVMPGTRGRFRPCRASSRQSARALARPNPEPPGSAGIRDYPSRRR